MNHEPVLLLIDNYDSFTYNLAQAFWTLDQDVHVHRNDQITLDEIEELAPDRIVISPGPGHPADAGICPDLVRAFARRIPILGVCLGHQCLAHSFGGDIVRTDRLMHGKTSAVDHDGTGVHTGIPQGFAATRYHSLVVDEKTLPSGFHVTARARGDSVIMGIADESRGLYGVQYHPESVLTHAGIDVLSNFLRIGAGHDASSADPVPENTRVPVVSGDAREE